MAQVYPGRLLGISFCKIHCFVELRPVSGWKRCLQARASPVEKVVPDLTTVVSDVEDDQKYTYCPLRLQDAMDGHG